MRAIAMGASDLNMPAKSSQMALEAAVAHYQAGRRDQAEELCRQILTRDAAMPEACFLLGILLTENGQLSSAVDAYRKAQQLRPGWVELLCNLGGVLDQLQSHDEALQLFGKAAELRPDSPELQLNLGLAYRKAHRPADAIQAFTSAVRLQPKYVEALYNLGEIQLEQNSTDEAIATLGRALQLNPNHANSYVSLGSALLKKKRFEDAIAALRTAIRIQPNLVDAHFNLGVALRDAGQFEESAVISRHVIEMKPDMPGVHLNLGYALQKLGRMDEAIAAYRDGVARHPQIALLFNNLGSALKDARELDAAIAAFVQAMRIEPQRSDFYSNYLYTLLFHPESTAEKIHAEHARWRSTCAAAEQLPIPQFRNDRDANRRLRIGYVSSDFRDHVVGQNMLPLFREHDRGQFEIIGYANQSQADGITAQFQRHAHQWRNIADISDSCVFEMIRQDGIDILVDLSLHMAGNRLPLFAHKPAPVQITFAGYPGSTGLTAIDYRLTDPFLDPPGCDETIYSESSHRLPETFWCYRPLGAPVPVNALPAQSNGFVTFGCLNNFCKVNQQVLHRWAEVLLSVPASRMVLLCFDGVHRRQVLDTFERAGVERERIAFVAPMPRERYLKVYHRIDIGLDTLPYNGHTTSLDSLWMGVPVITLAGQTVVGRAGVSQLSNLRMTELIAQTQEEYVRIATQLAGDLPRLADLRRTLRPRMESSPLTDAPKFARNIEAAYRQMWRKWCESSKSNVG